MCGICGILDFSELSIRQDLITNMTKTLAHRGPDDSGSFVSGAVALGHTRLSILDLSSSGQQPMLSHERKCALVFNGEIYNFPELKRELEQKGIKFKSTSDTEVVLNAYLEWGTDSFAKLKGMFALALWDGDSERLYMARDRFGIKPVYYYRLKSGIVFGSEVKAMLASNKIERGVNLEALHEYFYYGASLGARSLFKGIAKLLPGHFLTVDRGVFHSTQFASTTNIQPVFDSLDVATQEVRRRLEESIKRHLLSDVPVGVFLSGGIDSSTITALASRYYEGSLKTFSVGFDFDRGINELPKANMVAKLFGTEHHELHIGGKDVPRAIENLVRCHDEPFADAANIPLYLLCEELKGSIKVVLQGDGGDEIFAGYRRYNVLAYERTWRLLSCIGSFLGRKLPHSPSYYRYMRFFQAMKHPDPAMRMALLMTEEPFDAPPTRVLSKEVRDALDAYDPFSQYQNLYASLADQDPVQRMLYTDCNIILPDIFLQKVDKSTMAHGLEVRVPFLDNDLTSYVMGLPSSMKVRRGQKKWLLRRAMRGVVPNYVLDGKKTGFSVPYSWWLREPLAEYMKSVLLDKSSLSWGIFDEDKLISCIDDHIKQRRNNGFLLYKLLNLALWYQFYIVK